MDRFRMTIMKVGKRRQKQNLDLLRCGCLMNLILEKQEFFNARERLLWQQTKSTCSWRTCNQGSWTKILHPAILWSAPPQPCFKEHSGLLTTKPHRKKTISSKLKTLITLPLICLKKKKWTEFQLWQKISFLEQQLRWMKNRVSFSIWRKKLTSERLCIL